MSTIKKGILTKAGEWAKHLRPWGKRNFLGKEREAVKKDIRERVKE